MTDHYFLFHNESEFVLWTNDSFGCTLSLLYDNRILYFLLKNPISDTNVRRIERSIRRKRKSVLFYFNWIAFRVLIFNVRFGFQETGNFLGIETVVILWTSGRILIGQWNIILTCTNVQTFGFMTCWHFEIVESVDFELEDFQP